MLGRLKWVCSISGILALTIAFLFAPIGCGKPSATTNGDQSTADKEGNSQFAVPNGSPAKILEFIKELRDRNPKFQNHEEALDHSPHRCAID